MLQLGDALSRVLQLNAGFVAGAGRGAAGARHIGRTAVTKYHGAMEPQQRQRLSVEVYTPSRIG